MRECTRTRRLFGLLGVAVLAVALGVPLPAWGGTPVASSGRTGSASPSPSAGRTGIGPQGPVRAACDAQIRPGQAACQALIRTDVTARRASALSAAATPSGYGPGDLQSAYALPSATAGSGATVAIVDAFDDPNAEADLAAYRDQYGLPPCTTANGCFRKVAQDGSTSYPLPDAGWAGEESLDVDMVSAACPSCHILLVEATDNALDNLAASVDEAVALGALYVSNSYASTGEDPTETSGDVHYNHPGVVITAASGDLGFGPVYPAASPGVTAVGGTSLTRDASTARGWTESVWSTAPTLGAGSGCSQFEPKPVWQTDSGCANRTIADVSAVADPQTGVAVYDTFQSGGWQVFGGTSVATPVIASIYALAGTPQAGTNPAQYPYDAALVAPTSLNDVTTGATATCSPAYLCSAEPGYDGPTGLGTPNGVGAFDVRAHGDLTGTVTDAATTAPVAGAQVQVGNARPLTTDADGRFDLSLPVGSYPVTVSDFGYETATGTVTITAGTTTTDDVALTGVPHETVSGTVTAGGGGQPWPLYAEVTWSDNAGHGGSTFTTPATGEYALSLLSNASYQLQVTPLHTGYEPATDTVAVGTSAVTHDVALGVDTVACTAIGYHAVTSGLTQTFDATKQPHGWSVTNTNLDYPGYSNQPGWVFTNPGNRANATGGADNFAVVDSDEQGQFHYQDTHLTSATVDLTADTHPALQFDTDLQPAVNSTATVEASTDGGRDWTTMWRQASFPGSPGPAHVVVPLPQAVGKSAVQVRFDYTGQWSQYWEIDDVFLGNRTCVQQDGGLLIGRVTDTATGAAINAATVASVSNPGETAVSMATPGDDTVGGGLYELFTTAIGSQQFIAAATGYATATQAATITAGQVSQQSFQLELASTSEAHRGPSPAPSPSASPAPTASPSPTDTSPSISSVPTAGPSASPSPTGTSPSAGPSPTGTSPSASPSPAAGAERAAAIRTRPG